MSSETRSPKVEPMTARELSQVLEKHSLSQRNMDTFLVGSAAAGLGLSLVMEEIVRWVVKKCKERK
jgi:uncharacterized protein (DUF2062 family)